MPKRSTLELESREEAAAKRLPPQKRLSAEPSITKLVAETQRQMEIYEGHLLANIEFLNPQDAIENLRRQIQAATDLAQVAELQSRVAALSTMSGEAQAKARDFCRIQFDENVKPALLKLVGTALGILDDHMIEAATGEELLFEQFGMRHEATGVQRRVASAVAIVRGFKDGFESNVPTLVHALPPPRHPALSWFAGTSDENDG